MLLRTGTRFSHSFGLDSRGANLVSGELPRPFLCDAKMSTGSRSSNCRRFTLACMGRKMSTHEPLDRQYLEAGAPFRSRRMAHLILMTLDPSPGHFTGLRDAGKGPWLIARKNTVNSCVTPQKYKETCLSNRSYIARFQPLQSMKQFGAILCAFGGKMQGFRRMAARDKRFSCSRRRWWLRLRGWQGVRTSRARLPPGWIRFLRNG